MTAVAVFLLITAAFYVLNLICGAIRDTDEDTAWVQDVKAQPDPDAARYGELLLARAAVML